MAAGTAAVVALLSAHDVAASNGAAPRTKPAFHRQACLTVVDRSVDPVFHLDWSVPFEDVQITPDELDDSRRFQFFALCRQPQVGETLPEWIVESDAQRSLDAGLIDTLPPDGDVLELSQAWATGPSGGAVCSPWSRPTPDSRFPATRRRRGSTGTPPRPRSATTCSSATPSSLG